MNGFIQFPTDATLWVQFGALFVSTFVILYILKRFVLMQLHRFAEQTENDIDDFFVQIARIWDWLVIVVLSLFSASQVFALSTKVQRFWNGFVFVVIGWYTVRSINTLIDYVMSRYVSNRHKTEPNFDATILVFIKKVIQIIIWILAILMVIQNLGYQVSALLGGLGIGGIAIAFAVQNLLGDVFSSISIYFDRPFKLGDFIVVGEDSGTVKKIGIKSTRLQTIQGEELVISNKELTETRVHNYKRMQRRRVAFQIGVEYETPHKKLEKVNDMVQKIIDDVEKAEFSRSHLKDMGDFSLNYEVVYHVTSREYSDYMDVQQEINFAILKQFDKEGIGLAYPTQKVYTAKTS